MMMEPLTGGPLVACLRGLKAECIEKEVAAIVAVGAVRKVAKWGLFILREFFNLPLIV